MILLMTYTLTLYYKNIKWMKLKIYTSYMKFKLPTPIEKVISISNKFIPYSDTVGHCNSVANK